MKKAYVIVMNPGTRDEEIFNHEFWGTSLAYERMRELEENFPKNSFDVLKKLPDGSYTTEF